jgi:DNA primase
MPPHLPGQAREREEHRQRALGALRARLHDDAQALRTPDDWGACLGLATRLPGEDFANILLIHAERPGATLVRDYQQWTAAGRQVRKGEHGIAIFAIPPRLRAQRQDQDQDQPGSAWREADQVTSVWDLSQTTGPPLSDDAARPSRDPPAGVWDALCWLARREGYAVELEHGPPADGTVFWAARRIRIPPGLSGEQAVWALAHQLGHVLLHHDPGYPAGTTTSGCAGVRKAEADSVAWITCARHGITPAGGLPYPASWAGTDPRAQPAAAILAAGHRVTTAGTRITRHTSRILHGDPAPVLAARPGPATQATTRPGTGKQGTATPQAGTMVTQAAASYAPESDGTIRRILADAHAFYTGQLAGSWAPGYLHARGITAAAIQDWHIGYAPAGWTTLTSHLRSLGHHDDAIQAAGLATRSSRGTLIDRFRDRIMLPVHDTAGMLAGFTGRARPDAGPDTPKYLNSPKTATYKKSHLLFGLCQARPDLARGAIPVIVEGAFDAIAVSIAASGRHAGLAPCGTALTSQQAAQLSQAADLPRTGILVAFDSDTAGRKAAIRAHGILRPLTGRLQSAALDGKDPAEILQRDGPAALRVILREHSRPLSALLIDASIEQWGRRLDDTSGPLMAMRSAASLIASLLPDDTASQIRDITAGRELQTTDDLLRPVDNPEIPQIARILPADTSYQIVRAAGKLGFDCIDMLAEVANAATRNTGSAGHQLCSPHNDQGRSPAAPQSSAARLASTSFPRPPLTPQASPELPRRPAAPARRQRLDRLAR